jgi:hypothetical protein
MKPPRNIAKYANRRRGGDPMSETFSTTTCSAAARRTSSAAGTSASYEAFSRGALIGRLTATGKWQVIDEDNVANFSDFGIAVEAVDTTDGDGAQHHVLRRGRVQREPRDLRVQRHRRRLARDADAGTASTCAKPSTTAGV